MSKNYTDTSEDKKNDGKIAPFQTPVFYKPLFRVSTTVPVVPFSRYKEITQWRRQFVLRVGDRIAEVSCRRASVTPAATRGSKPMTSNLHVFSLFSCPAAFMYKTMNMILQGVLRSLMIY